MLMNIECQELLLHKLEAEDPGTFKNYFIFISQFQASSELLTGLPMITFYFCHSFVRSEVMLNLTKQPQNCA
jgi:hypothetical protein